MLDKVLSIALMVVGPLFAFLAERCPDQALEVVNKIGPVVDSLQAQVAAEVAKRRAKKSADNQAVS